MFPQVPELAHTDQKLASSQESSQSFGPSDHGSFTPFRAAEKEYKAKSDLSKEVLDLALLDEQRKAEVDAGRWRGRGDAFQIQPIEFELELGSSAGRACRAYCVPQIPGLVLLPGYLTPEIQRKLVKWSLAEHARWPNETNLDAHYNIPRQGLWNLLHSQPNEDVLVYPKEAAPEGAVQPPPGPRQLIANISAGPQTFSELASQPKPPVAPSQNTRPISAFKLLPRLRWANMGWHYHWGTKQYDFTRGKIDIGEPVRSLCKEVVSSICWENVFVGDDDDDDGSGAVNNRRLEMADWMEWETTYEPDAGLVNFYQYKDTLMGHVDRSEVCAISPLVSFSLGNAAVFLIGGATRDEKPLPILLRSGDAVIMAGPQCRRAYHGIPRILEGTCPTHLQPQAEGVESDWEAYGRYIQTARININVRQVFPKGFESSRQQMHRAGMEMDPCQLPADQRAIQVPPPAPVRTVNV